MIKDPREMALAAALESAVTTAMAAGLSGERTITVIAYMVGYSVANGSPSLNQTMDSLRLFGQIMGATAAEVFATRGAGMQTVGEA